MTEKESKQMAELIRMCREVCEGNLALLKIYERNLAKLDERVERIERVLKGFPEMTGDVGQIQ